MAVEHDLGAWIVRDKYFFRLRHLERYVSHQWTLVADDLLLLAEKLLVLLLGLEEGFLEQVRIL